MTTTETAADVATVHVHRADPVRDDKPVRPAALVIDLDQPTDTYSSPEAYAHAARARFTTDAATIADTLFSALPGGTLDALLAEILTRRGTLLRVPLEPRHVGGGPKPPPDTSWIRTTERADPDGGDQ